LERAGALRRFPATIKETGIMRVGIFGGTFDPVHLGHLLVAEQCLEQCGLDEVWFIPAGVPPHKLSQAIASGKARAEMLELAVAGHERFRVDRRELDRADPCYTIETLAALHSEDASRELYFILGGDSLMDFPTWREPKRICELAKLAVANRGGAPLPDLEPLRPVLGELVESRVQFVTIPGIDVSSSDVRRRVRDSKSIRYMTPRAVECYISTHKLYLNG
jgi:nicotinate-nucleotide adenylyltransferase